MKTLWIIFNFLLFLYSSLGSEVVTVDVHAAKELLASGHRYLDVRYGTHSIQSPVFRCKIFAAEPR